MPTNSLDEKLVEDNSKASLQMKQIGHTGLPTAMGLVRDDFYNELEYPFAAKTFKNMVYHPTVASAVTVIKDTIRKVNWDVKPVDDSEEAKEQAEFIQSCMQDMDRPWKEYINEFLSIITYGFSLNEKVFKRRKNKKSKFTDNKIGWKKLPSRNQASVKRWVWDEEGRDLIGVVQDLALVKRGASRYETTNPIVGIPIEKLLHFRHDAQLDNPEGNSPLKSAYIPWKYMVTIEEYEAVGISRDLAGMPIIYLPPEYMAENASDDKKAVYTYMQQVVRNINANEQAGLVFPRFIDPETKHDAFGFELANTQGGKSYDTDAIIRRYEQKILMSFLADVLIIGHGNTGSFSLASEKSNLLSTKIAAILDQIVEVINNDLIPHTFRINGWDDSETPKIVYNDFEKTSLDEVGKLVQRAVSVGALEVDKELSNKLRELIEVPPADESNPVTIVNPNNNGNGGEGMKTAGEGTATNPGGSDSSSDNNENAS